MGFNLGFKGLILGRRGNTQKTIYHYYNTAKAYKLESGVSLP